MKNGYTEGELDALNKQTDRAAFVQAGVGIPNAVHARMAEEETKRKATHAKAKYPVIDDADEASRWEIPNFVPIINRDEESDTFKLDLGTEKVWFDGIDLEFQQL